MTTKLCPTVWLVLGAHPDTDAILVAEGLITALRRTGVPAVGLKPIDIGCPHAEDHDLVSPDGDRLWQASERRLPPLVVAPYRFSPTTDPVAAAAAAGLELTMVDVMATVEEASRFGGPVVVMGPDEAEGPFAVDGDALSFARAASARVVLVTDDRHVDRLAALAERCRREQLSPMLVAHSTTPIDGAIHVPATAADREAVATALSPSL